MSIWDLPGWRSRLDLMVAGFMTLVMSVLVATGVAWGSASCVNAAMRTGASAGLPDCRAYEQVSPVAKGGFAAIPTAGTPVQTAPSGDRIAYLGFNAFPGALGSTALHAAHVSTRAASGWETTDWTPAVPKAEGLKIYKVDYAFSEDLSQGILRVPFVSLVPGSTPYAYNLFLRHSDGRYTLVNSSPPALPIEAFCGPEELASCFEFIDVSAFAGASNDFSHVAFESSAQLTAEAPGPFVESLYESTEGKVRLVGMLPDGSAAGGSTAGAGSSVRYSDGQTDADGRIEHAVSLDGSRIVFQAPADGGEPDSAQVGLTEVYDRLEGRETVELSASEAGSTPEDNTPRAATFWAASVDGSRVFFTSAADLTTQSKTGSEGGEDLYEYDFGRPAGEKLADISVDASPNDAVSGAQVLGVVDASSNGSYVYFVARGELIPGEGIDGQPNLYMVHDGGVPVFIATLSGTGGCSLLTSVSADACDWTPFLPQLEAYVTPDGRHLAFTSTMRLPIVGHLEGYDNIDRNTGEADSEVYEYDAQTGQLVCGSCDLTGAQPTGDALIGGIILAQRREKPGEQPYVGVSAPFRQARAMNDAGTQLFYNAPSLSGSSQSKVYEFEQNGQGSCSKVGGCQYMISSNGDGIDQYLGESAEGSDVFIVTAASLVSTDVDNLRDVYDVRVDGGFVAPPTETGCEGDCHVVGSAPDGGPSLVGYLAGPSGNLPAAPSKPLTVAQRRAKALKACRVKKNRRKRAHCEAVARHRYGRAMKSRSDRKGGR